MPDNNKIPMQPGAAQMPPWLVDLLKSWGSPDFWQQFANNFYSQLGAPARAVGIGRGATTTTQNGKRPLGISDTTTPQRDWKGNLIPPTYAPAGTQGLPIDSKDYIPAPYMSPEQLATQKASVDFNDPNSQQNLEARLAATGYDTKNDPQGIMALVDKGDPSAIGIIDAYWQAYQRQQTTNAEFNKTQTGYGINGDMSKDQFKQFGENNYQAQLKSNAVDASNNAMSRAMSNETIRNAFAEAASVGVDTSWFEPRMKQLTYDYQSGSTLFPRWKGDTPEAIAGSELFKQVQDAKGQEDYLLSQRLVAQYPMIAQRFNDIVAREQTQTLATKGNVSGAEVGYTGAPSFATFLKTNQPMTNEIQAQEKQNITKYPEMYTQYLGVGSPKSFMDWVNETPLKQSTFDRLYNKPITPRESSIPRWATAGVRF